MAITVFLGRSTKWQESSKYLQGEDQLHGIFGKINYLTQRTRHFQSLHGEKVFCRSTNGQETTILLAFAAASFYRFWREKHTATALMVPDDTYHYHLPMIDNDRWCSSSCFKNR